MANISVMISGRARLVAACKRAVHKRDRVLVNGSVDWEHRADLTTAVAKRRPRVLLIDDAHFADANLALISLLRRASPKTKIILLCQKPDRNIILDALALGVTGYVEEKNFGSYLTKAIESVAAGEAWLPRNMTALVAKRLVELAH